MTVFTSYTFPVTGGTTSRTTPNRAADMISVKEFGAVGNGITDDSAAMILAIASGLSIFVPAGIYPISPATILTPGTGQYIYGLPGLSIIRKTMVAGVSYAAPFFDIDDVQDVTIDGITFDEIADNTTARQFGFTLRATTLGDTMRVRICNCTFNNCPNFIERYVDTVWVHDNAFIGGGLQGGQNGVSTGGVIGATTTNGVVQNINISNNYFTELREEAIDINWNTWNVVINGNICVDCNLTGGVINEAIDIGGGDVANFCKNISVTNNVIQFTDPAALTSGIRVKLYSDNVVVSGNVIECLNVTGTGDGIHLKDILTNITVTNNSIKGFPYGIVGTFTVTPAKGFVIADNVVTGAGIDGIQTSGASSNWVISGNTIKTAVAATPQQGIELINVADFAVTGNRIEGFLVDGIQVAATSSDGSITGNEISGCNDGIRVLGPRVTVTGNTARNCQRNGFGFTAQHLTVVGNQAYNNSLAGASSYGFQFNAACDYAVIGGNKSYDTQGVPTQNGFNFGGASDRVRFDNNTAYPVKTTAVNNAGVLTNSCINVFGTGTPEGFVVAPIGSVYQRTNGGPATTLYVKESGVGNLGWIGK